MAPRVSPGIQTSPIYFIRGQRSRWRYPDQRLTPEHCSKLRNVNLSEFGNADVRFGYSLYNPVAIPSSEDAVALIQETWSTGTAQLVVTPTKIYVDDGTTRTNVTGSVTLSAGGADDRYRHAYIKDTVAACNGKDAIWIKNNDNDSSPANATPISFNAGGITIQTCEDLIEHRGLLLAFAPTESGTKFPTRIRWCDINTQSFTIDIANWPDNNKYELFQGGSAIVGAVDNFGQILTFKQDGMYPGYIEYDTGFLEYRPGNPQRGFHPIAKSALVKRPEFVFGVAREGAFVIRPDMSFEIVTQHVQDVWNNLNPSRLQYAHAWIREKDHQVRCLLSQGGNAAGHDIVLVWDWETGDVFFDEPTDVLNVAERVILSDVEYDWTADVSSKTYKGNSGPDDNGTGFAWEVAMAPNDLGMPGKTKNIINVNTIYRGRDRDQAAELSVILDQGQTSTRTATIDFNTGRTWNSGINWNQGLAWNSGEATSTPYFCNRSAETIAPVWRGNDPATIIGYQCEFEVVE